MNQVLERILEHAQSKDALERVNPLVQAMRARRAVGCQGHRAAFARRGSGKGVEAGAALVAQHRAARRGGVAAHADAGVAEVQDVVQESAEPHGREYSRIERLNDPMSHSLNLNGFTGKDSIAFDTAVTGA